MATRRILHFVFKVADRRATTNFYREILGMKVRADLSSIAIHMPTLIYMSSFKFEQCHSCCRCLDMKSLKKVAKLLAMGRLHSS